MISRVFMALAAAGMVLLGLPGAMAHASPKVAVSIPPLHSLVDSIMGVVGSPTLMLSAGQSPHHASLSPSTVRTVGQSELVIWVGPQLENGLHRVVGRLAPERVLTLSVELGDSLLDNRGASRGANHEHAHDDDHGHEGNKMPGLSQTDPHLWLSAASSADMVEAVAAKLIAIDPDNAGVYAGNAVSLLGRLETWRNDTAQRLAAVKDEPFMVYHDAYHYFEKEFSLTALAAVTVNPEYATGARRLVSLRQQLQQHQLRCLFTEPQFEQDATGVLVENTETRLGVMDPLGIGLDPGPNMWFQLMDNLVDGFLDCMQPAR